MKTARQSESRIARYEQKSREGKVGSRERKGRKKNRMRAKRRLARFKVGPRAPSSRAARDRFPPPRQAVLSSHELPPRTSFNPSRPSECPFGPRKDWHANRDKLRRNRNQAGKPRKSERAKIESFILCPTFLVPRNVKQRRGNCHNPIFTHRIFSRVGT